MSEKMMKKSKLMLVGLLSIALTVLTIWGCGSTTYDTPVEKAVTTKTTSALIAASELKGWMDAGLVNKQGGYDRVVILDVNANETDGSNKYNTVGHIPGAQLISGGSGAFMDNTRPEGPFSVTGSMVCNGATIDAIVQNAGIDQNTTIVLTSANPAGFVNVARAYTTFRYWGFPKNRLKVLNGGNAAWDVTYDLTTVAPAVKKSAYGVAQNGKSNVNTDMRVSLPEMIAYVKGIVDGNAAKVTLVDTVRGASNISSTTDLLATGYTPFDGAIKGSYSYVATSMTSPASTLYFKDAATIKADLSAALGTDGATAMGDTTRNATKTFISFCRAGNYASVGFFALDGIAYYDDPTVDVKWYDGSLGQWNLLASSDHTAVDTTGATVNAGGKLAVGSIWDTTSLMDNLTWNVSRTVSATNLAQRTIVNYASRVYGVEPSFAEGNQIETEDKAYRSAVSGTSGGGSAGGGGC